MELTTERLFIRTLQPEDWREMQKIFIDFGKSPYVIYDSPLPVEDAGAKQLTAQFADSKLFFAVFEKGSAEMLGYVCFHKAEEGYDMGYCFHSKGQGKGYALESCRAMMDYFYREQGVKVFTAGTAIKNTPSCRLLAKLGFECLSTRTFSFHKDSQGEDIPFEGGHFVRNMER